MAEPAVWVSDPGPRSLGRLKDLPPGAAWSYLGSDAAAEERLEAFFRGRGRPRPLNEELQRAAAELQKEYADYVARLAPPEDDLRWWAGAAAEKNPETSRLFFRLCGVLAARRLKEKSEPGAWAVFADGAAARDALARELGPGAHRSEPPVWERAASRLRELAAGWAHRALFFWRHVRSIGASRRDFRPAGAEPLTLIFTWIDARALREEGEVRDFFWGDLPGRLEARGCRTRFVPRVMPTADRPATWRRLRASPRFLPPAAGLAASDVWRRLWQTRRRWRFVDPPPFRGVETAGLLDEDARREWVYPRAAENMLWDDVVRGWVESGMKIERFLFPYENHAWEKAACRAFRRMSPGTLTVGYQHARLPRVLPNYYPSALDRGPRPDRVVANGRLARRRLLEAGYPADAVVLGAAWRFRGAAAAPRRPEGRGELEVLAAFPIGEDESRELYRRVRDALGGFPGVRVRLRPHPDTPLPSVLRGLADGRLPANFVPSEGPFADELSRAGALVYSTSSACLEAAAAGVPALHYVIGSNLDGDPLDFAPDLKTDFTDAAGLRRLAEAARRGELPRPSAARAAEALGEMFEAPGESSVDAFLGPRP